MLRGIIKTLIKEIAVHAAVESAKKTKSMSYDELTKGTDSGLKKVNKLAKKTIKLPAKLIHSVTDLLENTLDDIVDVVTLQIEDEKDDKPKVILLEEDKDVKRIGDDTVESKIEPSDFR